MRVIGKSPGTIARAISILRVIARESFNGLRLSDICEITNLPQSTAHRLLQMLVAEGLVQQDAETRRYGLGALNFELGIALSDRPFYKQLRPKLEKLSAASKETVGLFARSGSDTVCIDRVNESGVISPTYVEIGARRPLCLGASGLALIARLRNSETNKIILANSRDIEEHPLVNMRSTRSEIREARKRGYAVARDLIPGRATVAVALPLNQNMPPMSVTISTYTHKLTTAREHEFYRLIQHIML